MSSGKSMTRLEQLCYVKEIFRKYEYLVEGNDESGASYSRLTKLGSR